MFHDARVPAVLAYGLVYTIVACFCSVFVPSLTPIGFVHMTAGLPLHSGWQLLVFTRPLCLDCSHMLVLDCHSLRLPWHTLCTVIVCRPASDSLFEVTLAGALLVF